MKQNEHDIQRFMQIREEIHAEIEKIEPCVASLRETAKRVSAHFEVFEKLSQTAQEQIKSTIKAASHEMARDSAKEFSQLIEEKLRHKLMDLDQSVRNAQRVLNETMGDKYKKVVLFSFIGCVLFGLAGFGGGHFYAQRNTYALPAHFIKIYTLGLSVQTESLEKQLQEKRIKKAIRKK